MICYALFTKNEDLAMAIAKRIFLFLIVNVLVVACISFLLYIFNVQPFLRQNGLDITSLAIFCLFWGMGGAFISLLLSKVIAKWSMRIQLIDPRNANSEQKHILNMVYNLAAKAGLPKMPEVGIYASPELNAFATGPSRSNSLVAISTGLLQRMSPDQVEGVVGHEITHIANGDMVTMTILQGVINAFVMFLARLVAYVLSGFGNRQGERRGGSSLSFYLFIWVFEMIFMFLGSIVIASFSRRREFRADIGGAKLSSPENMISALRKLKSTYEIQDSSTNPQAFQAFKISAHPSGLMRLFASHPPLDERIQYLQTLFRVSNA